MIRKHKPRHFFGLNRRPSGFTIKVSLRFSFSFRCRHFVFTLVKDATRSVSIHFDRFWGFFALALRLFHFCLVFFFVSFVPSDSFFLSTLFQIPHYLSYTVGCTCGTCCACCACFAGCLRVVSIGHIGGAPFTLNAAFGILGVH